MNWEKVIRKFVVGGFYGVLSSFVATMDLKSSSVTGVLVGFLNAGSNWFKNKHKKSLTKYRKEF